MRRGRGVRELFSDDGRDLDGVAPPRMPFRQAEDDTTLGEDLVVDAIDHRAARRGRRIVTHPRAGGAVILTTDFWQRRK